jgi:hypothetical protein
MSRLALARLMRFLCRPGEQVVKSRHSRLEIGREESRLRLVPQAVTPAP